MLPADATTLVRCHSILQSYLRICMHFIDLPKGGERAVLVYLERGPGGRPWSEDRLEEFLELARSAGAEVAGLVRASRLAPEAKYLVGQGKVEEIRQALQSGGAALVIVDHPLTPAQERNLSAELGCRVLDRTGLILDIFAQRASTFEGKLQVELAQLRHLASRLVRGWSHLERQRGGIGLRGPGETQLETDRRLIGRRIRLLVRRLEKVRRDRGLRRRARRRAGLPTVALVGYTNAGKSTLFNALTGAQALAEDRLFATLDPTLRRLELPGIGPVVLADTVGFIRDLPHDLVAAFRATLEETREALLLLHVVDAATPERRERVRQVEQVLEEIGAGAVPRLEVYNKVDRLGEDPRLERDGSGQPVRVWLSAARGAGLELLRRALAERCHALHQGHGEAGCRRVRGRVHLDPANGRLRAQLFDRGMVRRERLTEDGRLLLEVELWSDEVESLRRQGCQVEAPGC